MDEQVGHRDVVCARLAAGQQGVITRAEALACGHTRHSIQRLSAIGLWRRVLPGVWAVGEGKTEWHQRLAALAKWSHGVASHKSAAMLLHLDGIEERSLEVLTERRLRAPGRSMTIHWVARLPSDSIVVEGIPTTSATRTLFDLAGEVPLETLELSLEDALRRRLTSLPRIRWCLATTGGQGRKGTVAMRRLLRLYEYETAPTASEFEARLHQQLRNAHLPLPQRQYEIRDGGGLLGRADFAYPTARLAIEAVSFRWHSGRAAWAHDQARWNALVAAGWRVLNVTWDDLTKRPQEVIDRIGRALGRTPLFE